MSRRAYRNFLIAVGVLVAMAAVFHFFAPNMMRSLAQAIHGR